MRKNQTQFLMQRFVFSDGENIFLNMFFNEKLMMQDYMFETPATATIEFPVKYISGKFTKESCHVSIFDVSRIELTMNQDRVMTISKKTVVKGILKEVLKDLPEQIKIEINHLINKNLKK